MSDKKSKKACEVCKRRKKRCSGGRPCDYCIKIDKQLACTYRVKVSSKTVKVTEKYLVNLKSKIKDLELQLATRSNCHPNDVSTNDNPLVSSEDDEEDRDGMDDPSEGNNYYRLGNSACGKFLLRIKDSLGKSCQLRGDVQPDYEKSVLDELIWTSDSHNADFVKYATEVTRFFTYLALGCLFNKDRSPEKTGSKFPGLQYFETALRLQSELLKVYDMMANTSLVQSFLYVAYYALSLDKPEFAYLTIGSAIRMVFTLNYHKKTTTFTENRVFWLCFVYDRLVSVRFGFPLMINELDIDVSLLNEPTISSQETLIDSCHFNWQVKLANIITQTLRKIYTRNSFSFIHNCYTVLKELKYWLDGLPDDLKIDMDNFSTTQPRSTINLHINYNYTIIITTRPVFLYVFNKVADSEQKAEELFPKKLLNTITTLLESSVQAAQIQSFILTKLYFEGRMVSTSFLDCHYIFNATIILIFAAFCQSRPNHAIFFGCDINTLFERVQVNLRVLQSISQYNIAACNFNKQLTEIIELIGSTNVHIPQEHPFPNPSVGKESDAQLAVPPLDPGIDLDLARKFDLSRILHDIGDNSSELFPFDNEDFLKYSFF
ncbi:BCE_3a_G0033510.mRNA.1.CDS.1 [Saccharomyces cerevisiae]|nr:BCE_3a_G0033510.mRNA.1.CDS.1 [Saccharomyces cerevisiae]CAI5246866.1 CKB_HP2_G0009080.mRNA.1.CDS.1 [Saccharomyces cerevisiae]CAI6426537.1 CKB_HP2_G0009080.mRNA.1.CDS.1 [Saccharomyces cerevisiae]CAI7210461.1 BCE_3a_G0033510.mRNA.1.CDS.1 [Saccharomyces cerevisiae]